MTALQPRVVVATRPTDYERLLQRHATHAQAAFFLRTRDQDIDEVRARHELVARARSVALDAIPASWRRSLVSREQLDRFLFEPDDLVVAVGQDGLVANLAKYLDGQPVIGLNPEPEVNAGVLVPHPPEHARELLPATQAGRAAIQERTMARAQLDNGQQLMALNEVFIGHRSHQSARYHLSVGQAQERQSSSGLIIATGSGATGWACSIQEQRRRPLELPGPDDRALAYYVREAYPSIATGTNLTEGLLRASEALTVTSQLDEGGVLFGDGIEDDHLDFAWGMTATVRVADTTLRLVQP